jgi:anaerobic magnesium-protoporphyrin IX monomethyl ester cyclase
VPIPRVLAMNKDMRVLLINPSWKLFYKDTKVKGAVPYHPVLSLAALGGSLIKNGCDVKILDFNLPGMTRETLPQTLRIYRPQYVGFTFTTPLFPIVSDMCADIKKTDRKIITIGGGPHATALPSETLRDIKNLDFVIIGEGDFTLPELVKGVDPPKIKGIGYRRGGKAVINPPGHFIEDLDSLPLPAWHLFDIKRYRTSRLISKKDPVGFLETSRGCVFNCCFCNKLVHGRTFRIKSVGRVLQEIEYMLKIGFREIYIVDDGFSTDMDRAEKICREIIRRKLRFPWTLTNGIRVDRVNPKLFRMMKKAGCYRVAFGIESGNQRVLDTVGKCTNPQQVRDAVKWANRAGIETWGYFVIGLPGDDKKSIRDTINFAKSLDLYTAKFSILIPFPGSAVFAEWDARGLIKNKNWGDYNMYTPSALYDNPGVSWGELNAYERQAFREFYLRPSFIVKRALRDLRSGMIMHDVTNFFKTKW